MFQIIEICVSTPHNYPQIMGGRHKNFYDPTHKTRDVAIINFEKGGFFISHALIILLLIFFFNKKLYKITIIDKNGLSYN